MRVDQIQDRILSWWWDPSLVSAAVAVPATSSIFKVIDVIGTTGAYFDVGGEKTMQQFDQRKHVFLVTWPSAIC